MSQPLVIAFIDVDHLKLVNDAEGHAAGDGLLRAVVNALRANLRPQDLIVRYGGDEFICAVTGVDLIETARRFALVNDMLAQTLPYGSVSIGHAQLLDGDSLEDLIARADASMYQSRRSARET